MPKFMIILSMLFLSHNVLASERIISAFSVADSDYINKLKTCDTMQNIKTLHYGAEEVNLYQEILGVKDNKCEFTLGIVEEYLAICKIPQDQLNIITSFLKSSVQSEEEIYNIFAQNCLIEGLKNSLSFKDSSGVEFGCDTIINVQMVSDEECLKCSNRTLVEDKKIKLSGKPLTYCVLKYCPNGYHKETTGKCIIEN